MLRSFHCSSISLRVACRTTPLYSTPLYSQHPSVVFCRYPAMPPKRKRSAVASTTPTAASPALSTEQPQVRKTEVPLPPNVSKLTRRQSSRGGKAEKMDPTVNPEILDGAVALRASPDGHDEDAPINSVLSAPAGDAPAAGTKGKPKKAGAKKIKTEEEEDTGIGASNGVVENAAVPAADTGISGNPEDVDGPEAEEGDEAEVKEALSRPPPVNSDYLPLPWKGRLGYACLNTYLRSSNPPVFSSRTCRIASIIEHRHPLKDPSQPEHATKNRPDREQSADVERGMRYVEEIGLANARDIIKMVRWNDKYGIKFMRLSSEMFPFASHEEYGYKLEPFAADTLREVGKVIAELGHRVTTHPGQFTQLGSPRKQVIENAVRDLEYHDEMLSLLKLPEQQNRDAVMILHLGGAYGDKPAAIERFKENYAKLPQSVKNRLVLENDDVVWSVHELLPLCEELNIPFVLDYHHHNIIFDETQIREGTKDIMELYPRILETWHKKGITPKMHYSEPTPAAVTRTARRKHSPRVMTFPPCPDTMDLMIEAKDKEQAVFELMRTFKLPGFDTFNDIIPHTRQDENKPWKPKPKKTAKKGKKKMDELDELDAKIEDAEEEEKPPPVIPDEEVGMGGPEGRVYWPPGMEDWLRPPKRIIKKKDDGSAATITPAKKKRKTAGDAVSVTSEIAPLEDVKTPLKSTATASAKQATQAKRTSTAKSTKKRSAPKSVPTPSASSEDEDGDQPSSPPLSDVGTEHEDAPLAVPKRNSRPASTRKKSARAATARVSYKEEEEADEMDL